MISILGTLRKVNLTVKEEDKRVYHNLSITIEITEGQERVQDIVDNIRQIIQLDVNPKQPRLHEPKQPEIG